MIFPSGRLVHVAAGFSVWAIIFALIYGMQGVGCRLDWDKVILFDTLSLQRIQLVAVYVVGLCVLMTIYACLSKHKGGPEQKAPRRFVTAVAVYGALAAFAAASLSFVGVMWLTAC
ncbi:hypothetical protein APY04_3267 [Hyphomicrobium sulfonivorans]|uniref:Uncharacterized protein n=1 Tax=Hyphomicrobium sulfonivorans TaxID=121290 RepID=A0A120CTC2_HYPSL|nr:hypothetical protein [Hyphomicrobium sulfonivorans]KWT64375.1 hypothetical protein APY04_3267 [Hyphomicrobium sulfonivorans]